MKVAPAIRDGGDDPGTFSVSGAVGLGTPIEAGDLTGSHGVPIVSGIAGATVTGTPPGAGYALVSTSTSAAGWSAVMTNPMTTIDDIIVAGASGVPGRLGKGSDGQVLTVDPTTHHLLWATPTALTNPMTTKGDVILGDTGGTPTRLAAGTSTFVLTSNGAAAFPSWQAGGGGGGSDLVQTYSGAGSVYIPGLRGDPAVLPASPNINDDEFEAFSGWTTLGTVSTSNVSDKASHWHGKTSCASVINGIYKAIPSLPCTIIIKMTSFALDPAGTTHPSIGIMLLDSTPTAIREFSFNMTTSGIGVSLRRYTSRTAFSSSVDVAVNQTGGTTFYPLSTVPVFLKLLVTSSSSVTFSYSFNGDIYITPASLSAISPTITPAYFGILLSDPVSTSTPEVFVDYIRIT